MASKVEIYNLAISHLGIGKTIVSVDEDSVEATILNRFYNVTVEQVLRDFDWPFATKEVSLGLLGENPNGRWAYNYQYPSDCLKARKIVNEIMRQDTRETRIPYKILFSDTGGKSIYTDKENAILEYTVKITDPARFDSDFVLALSYLLGGNAAPGISGGDDFKNRDFCIKMYDYQLTVAQSNAANEEQADLLPESEFMRARDQ